MCLVLLENHELAFLKSVLRLHFRMKMSIVAGWDYRNSPTRNVKLNLTVVGKY